VKRNDAGGVQFSRDPLNPVNYHSRKVNLFLQQWQWCKRLILFSSTLDMPTRRYKHWPAPLPKVSIDTHFQALGLEASENGGISLIAKNASNTQNPAKNIRTTTFGPHTSNRK
jgi:large subunit ribosomal protein L28e